MVLLHCHLVMSRGCSPHRLIIGALKPGTVMLAIMTFVKVIIIITSMLLNFTILGPVYLLFFMARSEHTRTKICYVGG